jgi:hypothetical protein
MSETSELPASFTLQLKKEVTFAGGKYAELVLREPTAKEALRADEQLRNGATMPAMRNREIHLVSMVAGVPVPVIESILLSDLNRCMAYLNPFFSDGLPTGMS